eukprot:2656421-Amphidinium_carterae.1
MRSPCEPSQHADGDSLSLRDYSWSAIIITASRNGLLIVRSASCQRMSMNVGSLQLPGLLPSSGYWICSSHASLGTTRTSRYFSRARDTFGL